MARMLPSRIAPEVTSSAERRVYEWLENDPATEDWIVLHSLGLARHEKLLFGEVDFVVLAPYYGVFCLEIKGGRVSRANGFWEFANKYGETNRKVRGPFDQARDGMFSLMKEIRSRFRQENGYASLLYGYGVVFPDIDFDIDGPDYDKKQIWDRTASRGTPISSFIVGLSAYTQENQLRVYGASKERALPSPSQVRSVANALRGDFDRPMLLAASVDETESKLARLTHEQFRCLDMFEDNKRVLVTGSAGTGKTLLAFEKARRAFAQGERVGYFCFNSLLASWSKEQLCPWMTDGSYVGTFHAFMISKDKRGKGGFENDYFSNVLPQILVDEGLLRDVSFDRIIVDEVQDLITDEYLAVFDCILKDGLDRGGWSFFGDFARQAIYQRGSSKGKILALLDGYSTYAKASLIFNCRNTKSIGTQTQLITGLEGRFPTDAVVGEPVTFKQWHSEEDEERLLVQVLTDLLGQGIQQEDIVILTPLAPEDSIASRASSAIPLRRVSGANGILFASIASFKGLESKVIVIADCTSYTDSSLYYVGITRARAKLCILENAAAYSQRVTLMKERLNEQRL